jgi:hypothetical protein
MDNVKIGDFVECVDDGSKEGLLLNITIGKLYEIQDVRGRTQGYQQNEYKIFNDFNQLIFYHNKRFRIFNVPEIKNIDFIEIAKSICG